MQWQRTTTSWVAVLPVDGTLVRLITSFVMAGTLFALSVFLLSVLKLSAFETGLMLMPMTVGMMLAIALIML